MKYFCFLAMFIGLTCCSSDKSSPDELTTEATNEVRGNNDSKNSTMDNNENGNTNTIDSLLNLAQSSGKPDDLSNLWRETLKLSQWHFISKYKENIEESEVFVGLIEDRPWVFVFTDRKRASEYCNNVGNTGFISPDGSARVISMDTDKAIEYILKLGENGVYGIRLNEGKGWFSPISNLNPIIDFVKGK